MALIKADCESNYFLVKNGGDIDHEEFSLLNSEFDTHSVHHTFDIVSHLNYALKSYEFGLYRILEGFDAKKQKPYLYVE